MYYSRLLLLLLLLLWRSVVEEGEEHEHGTRVHFLTLKMADTCTAVLVHSTVCVGIYAVFCIHTGDLVVLSLRSIGYNFEVVEYTPTAWPLATKGDRGSDVFVFGIRVLPCRVVGNL